MQFVPWPDIESFANMRRTALKYNKLPEHSVHYRSKIKLHGTNAAVRVAASGEYHFQSRTQVVTPEADNAGFARTMSDVVFRTHECDYILFGEWHGKGVNKGAAACLTPKTFSVFAVFLPGGDDAVSAGGAPIGELIVEPEQILEYVPDDPRVQVIPRHEGVVTVDMTCPENFVEHVCAQVAAVELRDPWVASVFGIEGIGEGLVYYPVNLGATRGAFSDFGFKAKGEEHRVKQSERAVTVDVVAPETREAFCVTFVTEARLRQGLQTTCGPDAPTMREMGDFLKWFGNDVRKESVQELEIAGLEWKQVAGAVTLQAKQWFMAQVEGEL